MNILSTPGVKVMERDDKRPTFSAKLESEIGKGGEVEIVIGEHKYTVMIDPADGSWSFTWPEDLDDGTYSLSIRATDSSGNDGIPKLYNLVISTTPPEPPELLNLYDDVGGKTGSFDAGVLTDDRRPTLTGLAKPGSIVVLMRDGEEIGSAVADPITGLWSLEPNQDLADGENSLTLVTRDTFAKKDRESEESEPFTIVVGPDATTPGPGPAPGLVFIDGAEDNVGANTGPLASGALTDDTRPELHGTAPAGSTLRLQYRSDNGDWIEAGNVPVNADGSWSWAPADALPDGSWEFRVHGEAGWTDEFALEISAGAQSTIAITHASDNKGPYTGELANGVATDDDTPTLHGRAEANSIVYIHAHLADNDAWSPLGSVLTGPDGSWSLTTTPLINYGSWHFQAGANQTADPQADTFQLDLIAPGSRAPVIAGAWDDVGNITGLIQNGRTTNDTTPELRGIAEANSVVMIEFGKPGEPYDTSHSVIANARGEWSFTPPQPLELGDWVFRTKTANGTSYSNSWHLNVTEGESLAIITEVIDNVGSWTGELSNPDTTDDSSPTLKGTAPDGSLVILYQDGEAIGSVVATGGSWEFTVPGLNEIKTYSFTAGVREGGTDGPQSEAWNITHEPNRQDWYKYDLGILTSRDLAAGETDTQAGIKLTTLRYGHNWGSVSNGFRNESLVPITGSNIAVTGSMKFEFLHGISRSIAFSVNDVQAAYTVRYYNSAGTLIEQKNYSGTQSYQSINYSSKTGESIASIDVTTSNVSGKGIDLLELNNFRFSVPSARDIQKEEESSDQNSSIMADASAATTIKNVDELEVINGGDGVDTLVITGAQQTLVLSDVADKLNSVEVIDITGSGDNRLELNVADVLNHGGRDLFIDDGKLQFMVQGNEGDTVQLDDLLPDGTDTGDWIAQNGTVTVAGVEYQVFSHSGEEAEVLIQQGIKTELI
ncbi:Ig-like domain-containing protein [Duffyella gerundensis]|uniref:Ig-like domain-containing protein n=1 Tax=Duffyella gerundensis TaxID=1619313 RepID=UPI0016541AE8